MRQLNAASLGWNFVTAPLVGGALGYGADWLLGSYPWSMIVGLFLGFVAAFVDLIRSVR
ncbi:MAG: AtpZ/AtpI family protein [bacterium]